MHHTGRVVSRTELVEHLYDQDFDRDLEHGGSIRRPDPQETRREIIQTVRGLGYCSRRLMRVDGMRATSLALRLFLSATAWAVIILLITGIVLCHSIGRPLSALRSPPGVYLRTLVADVASPEEAGENFHSHSANRCSNCRRPVGTGR
jgi:hypothetical protein